jgi:hypothetical protein
VGEDILSNFLISVAGNPNILPSHISLFSAILSCKKEEKSFNVSRSKLMKLSKLRSTATYHKCMNELVELGCVSYQPSFNPFIGSNLNIKLNLK